MRSDHTLPQLAAPATVAPARLERLVDELRQRVRGEVRTDAHNRMLFATDASMYQVQPLGVVIPADPDDIAAAVRFCGEQGIPIVPRGGGTGLAGQTVNHAVVIDCSNQCHQVIEIDAEQRRVRVQPGVVLDQLNETLQPFDLMFGPDVATASHANIGGMIGNNSAGAHSVLYGHTSDHVRSLDVVLPDGERMTFEAASVDSRVQALTRRVASVIEPLAAEIDARFARTRRRVNGYSLDRILDQIRRSTAGTLDEVNLATLLCGSEGTLAVTVGAELNLVERPASVGLAMIPFEGIEAALTPVPAILETGPAAVELIDDLVLDLAGRNDEYRHYVELLPRGPHGDRARAVLYVQYFGATAADVRDRLRRLESVVGRSVEVFTDPVAMGRAWKLRKAGEPLLHALPGRRKPLTFVEDIAVPPDRLVEFVGEFREMLERHGTSAAFYAHASVGCLHIRPLVDLRDDDDRRMMERIAEEATDLACRYEGALSGEHGDGRVRSHLLERFYGPRVCAGFRAIKALFDPHHLLNPGNIVGPTEMTANLRVRPDGQDVSVPEADTYFSYAREHGFEAAAEMCNGAGFCRRMTSGTMCPSYRATRDERHSTRGRGNALRLAITGQCSTDGTPAWSDGPTLETLDLCLSCKACRTECPSNVDIARLKSEYLAQHYRERGGAPWRTRLLGSVRTLHRMAGAMPMMSQLATSGLGASLMRLALGVHPRRSLPAIRRSWLKQAQEHDARGPAVLLFADCFTTWQEPEVGLAAMRVIERLGYRPVVVDAGCCGRSMISLGLLDDAHRTIDRTIDCLATAVATEDPVAMLVLEPSCQSAMLDDWPALRVVESRSGTLDWIARHTMSLTSFVASRWEEHPAAPPAPPHDGAGVMLHGHCHEKALWGTDATERVLRETCGVSVSVPETGCCGLAGSFGYARHRFDLSMTIAELGLFPALRDAPDTPVIASGTSCRHQIRDGLGRSSSHPATYLASSWGV